MASERHTFRGIAKWARVRTPNKFNNYTVDLYCDAATRKAIKAIGYRGSVKEDDEGNFYYAFRRPATKVFKDEEKDLGAPKVYDANGNPFDDYIGNGSEVEITVDRYTWTNAEHGSGVGVRLESIKVLTLVPYVPVSKEEEATVEEVVEAPKVKKTKVAGEGVPF